MFCCLERYMTDNTILRDAILTGVPGDGSTIGNQSLFEQLRRQFPQLTEDGFWAVRDALIDEGPAGQRARAWRCGASYR